MEIHVEFDGFDNIFIQNFARHRMSKTIKITKKKEFLLGVKRKNNKIAAQHLIYLPMPHYWNWITVGGVSTIPNIQF